MVVLSSPLVSSSGELLAKLSSAHHLPTMSMFRENVVAGCLMAYGPSLVDGWHRLGSFAGRLLKGAKPGDLPIERPTTFELVVNLKTSMALGLTIPPSLLARRMRSSSDKASGRCYRIHDPAVTPAARRSGDRIVKRRALIAGVVAGLLTAPLAAQAQQTGTIREARSARDLKTFKAFGLIIPQPLFARADQVLE